MAEDVLYTHGGMPKDSRVDGLSKRIDSLFAESAITRKGVDELRQQLDAPKSDTRPSKESWVKKHSGWFTIAAFVLGSGFILKVADGWIDSRIGVSMKDPSEKIITQGQTLSEIKGQLKEISGLLHIVVQKEMKSVAALPQLEFNKKLDEVKTVLAVARSRNVEAPDERVAESIRSKVADSDEDLDQYWGAAAEIINYESPSPKTSLPECLASAPVRQNLLLPNSTQSLGTWLEYVRCRIDVDDPRAGKLYAEILTSDNLRLIDCVVGYRGRSLYIPSTKTLRGQIYLTDCTFDIDPPARRPMILGEQLISSAIASPSLRNFTFKVVL